MTLPKDSRIEFSCKFAFFINFLSFDWKPKLTRILTLYQISSKHANFNEVQVFKTCT